MDTGSLRLGGSHTDPLFSCMHVRMALIHRRSDSDPHTVNLRRILHGAWELLLLLLATSSYGPA